MLRQEGRKAPDLEKLRPQDWEHILGLPTKSARKRYYQFLWQNEMKRDSVVERKQQKKIENAERLAKHHEENALNEHIVYGLNHNSIFLRIYDATITHFHNMKLIRSMMFDQKLIIDCSYDEHMNPREASNAGKQLMLCFAENRMHDEPFDLHLCNVNLNNVSSKILKRFIPTMLEDDFPLNIHSESLTETFDKSKLVYLTPHCNNDLVEYNPDDIYIIGAMVDKTNNEPLSLAKAKKQGLRMARLPLDRYLSWGSGSGKSLTLNQMVNIMLEMKKHGNWERALRFVPRRKLTDEHEQSERWFERPRYNDRRHNDNRENSDDRNRWNNNFNDQQSFSNNRQYNDRRNENRQPYNNDRRDFQNNRNFNNRENYQPNSRRDQFNDNRREYQPEQRNFSHEKSRSFKERKNFDKFKFNLDTWGKKMNQRNSDES